MEIRYIYSKYIEKVKIIIQKINDNIFDSKYSCSLGTSQ